MKILYIQHVDWHWIPQRPHFLARALQDSGHQVTVLYIRSWHRSGHVSHDPSLTLRIAPRPILGCPRWSHPIYRTVDSTALVLQLRHHLRRPYDAIWVTHPRLYAALSKLPLSCPIIYDCMDAAAEMSRDATYVQGLDDALLTKASLVFVSSPLLLQQATARAPRGESPHLIRNGCRSSYPWPALDTTRKEPRTLHSDTTTVFFYGTIGAWLDLPLLEHLQAQPDIRLVLIGPLRTSLPKSLLTTHRDALPQIQLLDLVQAEADCLILPFRNDVFSESVDPVKLYEYIGLGLPTLAPPLDVLAPARNFLTYYSTPAEAVRRIRTREWEPVAHQARANFVSTNTWTARAALIEDRLSLGLTRA